MPLLVEYIFFILPTIVFASSRYVLIKITVKNQQAMTEGPVTVVQAAARMLVCAARLLASTQRLTEVSTRDLPWEVKVAGE